MNERGISYTVLIAMLFVSSMVIFLVAGIFGINRRHTEYLRASYESYDCRELAAQVLKIVEEFGFPDIPIQPWMKACDRDDACPETMREFQYGGRSYLMRAVPITQGYALFVFDSDLNVFVCYGDAFSPDLHRRSTL